MQNANIKPNEIAVPIDLSIFPGSYAAGTVTTPWIHMGTFGAIMAMIALGAMTATATVNAKLEQATDSGGTGAKDVTGKAITELTAAGSDDEKAALIICRDGELDVANGFDYARLSVTVANAAVDLAAPVFGLCARYEPQADDTAVDEVVGS